MTPRAYAAALALSQDTNATPAERANAARRCAEYERAHGAPKVPFGKRPWWTLKIASKDTSCWLDNDKTFRSALRALRAGRKQREYVFEFATVKAVQDDGVDWTMFPDREPWRAPRELQAGLRAIEAGEVIVQWPAPKARMGTVRRKRKLREGELPGLRKVMSRGPRS